MSGLIPYIEIVALILLSAFFSGAEIAFTGANRIKLSHAAEEGSRAAKVALGVYDHFEEALSSILIGNNLVNNAASAVAAVIALNIAGVSGTTAATFIMLVIILIFGEIAPKTIAAKSAEKFSTLSAYPLRALMIVLYPLNTVVLWIVKKIVTPFEEGEEEEPTATEEELVTIIETIEQEGVIDEEKSDLLRSAIEFNNTTVGEIMTPRINTVFVDIEDSDEEIFELVNGSRFSRLPVYRGTVDNIVGILYLDRYYKALADGKEADVGELMAVPVSVHRTMKLPAALEMMKEKQVHIAIVVDEFGGTDGIVTLEDIVEQIVGEIWDENDEIVMPYTMLDDGTYSLDGEMSISDLFDLLDEDDKNLETECTTVGGWATEILESDPHLGDRFDFGDLHFTVTEMEDEIYIGRMTVKKDPPEDEKEENESDRISE